MSVTPGAINALVELFRGGLDRLQVLDGPEAAWPTREFLVVGLSPEDLMVPATRLPRGPESTPESADITCMIRSWTGDTAIRPRRDRAYQILDTVMALLAGNPTLGGACGYAEVTGSIYAPSQTQSGVVVDVIFVIRATSF